MTAQGGWSGKSAVKIADRRLRSRTRAAVNDNTGSTIMIIIVGPMIAPAARCCC
jgi:hypothetical protein